MSEQSQSSNDSKQEIVDYYFHDNPSDQALKEEYLKRGLVPTNNFTLYFLESSSKDVMEGVPHPYNYRHAPFGSILQNFRDTHPELWQQAVALSEQRAKDQSRLFEAFNRMMTLERRQQSLATADPELERQLLDARADFEALELESKDRDELKWRLETKLNQIIDDILPGLAAANVSPVELIK